MTDETNLPDMVLIEKIKAGCVQSLELLLARYYPATHRFAYRLSGSSSEAEEITQEAVIKIARGVKGFRGGSQFSTWIYRVTANVASDIRRKRLRQAKLQEAYQTESTTTEGTLLSSAENDLSQQVLTALDRLSEKERQAIVLTAYEQMSHAEAAKVMNCAEATISWRIFRAKQKIKSFIERSEAV